MTKIYLVIGSTGTGKTWVMKQLIKNLDISTVYSYKTGLYTYLQKDGIIILGKYDGSTFEGSDRLSMSVMSDNKKIISVFNNARIVIGEGDRFTNSTFIQDFNPVICKILGAGEEGRKNRGSSQTERQIKSIATRVSNIKADFDFENNEKCLEFLLSKVGEKNEIIL